MAPLTDSEMSFLRERVYSAAIVDGHAHSLLDLHSAVPFSEAEGEVSQSVPHTLSFKKSLRDIARLYGCSESVESIQAHRLTLTMETLCSKCFEGSNLSAVLIDDDPHLNKMGTLDWHKSIFPKVYRVLQIETLAESIINEGLSAGVKWTFDSFLDRFTSSLKKNSEFVVAFKSIAAYRGGLNINAHASAVQAEIEFTECIQSGTPICINKKCLTDVIFLRALEIATLCGLPMQLDTGSGDNDLDLSLANPLHIEGVLKDKRFTKSRVVLLHASYPFLKEASYLSSVYPQVYVDIGLAIPKISMKGMRSIVSKLLELAPLNKVMFSSDGALPETFFLGIEWGREVLLNVLGMACCSGDLSLDEATAAASDILGGNASKLYQLNLSMVNSTNQPSKACDLRPFDDGKLVIKHVRLLWCDFSGQRRCRVVPKERFEKGTKFNGVGMAACVMGMTSLRDCPAEGCGLNVAAGEVRIRPDLQSKRVIPWSKEEEVVLGFMYTTLECPSEFCPRFTLKRMADTLKEEFGLMMKAGFESEFYILQRNSEINQSWVGLDSSPYSSSSSFDAASAILTEISQALNAMDIHVEQLHAEAGGGQYEIVLNYEHCLKAADDLLLLQETVKCIVGRRGLLATFLPKFFPNDFGSGIHVHVSIWEGEKNVFKADSREDQYGISKTGQEFMAGIFHHLPSILAITAPLPTSYERLKPGTWSGSHHCWGQENKEAPLRAARSPGTHQNVASNVEVKSLDGCTNPHLGLAAIIAAGIDGLRKHLQLPEPIDEDPSSLADGSIKLLPSTLEESVAAFEQNEVLKEMFGPHLVKCITAIRKAEIDNYKESADVSTMLAMRY